MNTYLFAVLDETEFEVTTYQVHAKTTDAAQRKLTKHIGRGEYRITNITKPNVVIS